MSTHGETPPWTKLFCTTDTTPLNYFKRLKVNLRQESSKLKNGTLYIIPVDFVLNGIMIHTEIN